MKTKTKVILIVVLLLLGLLFGVGAMVYPLIAARYSETVRSEVHTEYEQILAEKDDAEINAILEAAIAYNRKLYLREIAVATKEDIEKSGYWDQMNIEGSDVMCYLRIPAISLELPVYHGIGEDSLTAGCGHMPQSSLPVGGENTHAVLSAHTGMATSAMFSNLPMLKVGDIFFVDVLGETLTYEVYNIPEPVLPHEIDLIQIQSGEDLCTLITCYPFGVNTHRFLVQGKRIPTPDQEEIDKALSTLNSERDDFSIYEAEYFSSVMTGVGIILCFCLLALLLILILRRKKKKSSVSATAVPPAAFSDETSDSADCREEKPSEQL